MAQPVRLWKGGVRDPDDETNARFWITLERKRDPHTVNDGYLNILRQSLKYVGKLRDPDTKLFVFRDLPKVERLKTTEHEADPIPDDVVAEILPTLPPHLQEVILLTAFFGFRHAEAFGLTVQQVDFQRKGIVMKARGVKERRNSFLAGSDKAMTCLRQLVDQLARRGVNHLITYKTPAKVARFRPIRTGYHTWRRRCWNWSRRSTAGRGAGMTCAPPSLPTSPSRKAPIAAQTVARHVSFATTQRYIAAAQDLSGATLLKPSQRPLVNAALKTLGGKAAKVLPQSLPSQDCHLKKGG